MRDRLWTLLAAGHCWYCVSNELYGPAAFSAIVALLIGLREGR